MTPVAAFTALGALRGARVVEGAGACNGIQAWVGPCRGSMRRSKHPRSIITRSRDPYPCTSRAACGRVWSAGRGVSAPRAAVRTHSPLFYVHWRARRRGNGQRATRCASTRKRAAYIGRRVGGSGWGSTFRSGGACLSSDPGQADRFQLCGRAGRGHAARRRGRLGGTLHRVGNFVSSSPAPESRAGQGRLGAKGRMKLFPFP